MSSTSCHRSVRPAIAFLLIGVPGLAQARAEAKGSEAEHAGQAIEAALQKHGADVHRCFEKVLADRMDAAGKVEVSVDVGSGGKVTAAKVQKLEKSAPPALAACIEKAAVGWTIAGIEKGARVVLPFSFKAQTSQYVVQGADVPDRALGGAAPGKGKPRRDAPFTVKVLADETNVRAQGLSLTLLSVGPASSVAMHRHPHSAKILYLMKGHARLLGPAGAAPLKLDDGTAVFVPAGYPHVIENMGRQSTAVFLQAFAPPGPERVYRDPADAKGRAEFEVIRNREAAKAPDEQSKLVALNAGDVKATALPGNVGTSRLLFDGKLGLAASVLEWNDGADVQVKGDGNSTRILFVLGGGGTIKVGGESASLSAETTIHLPPGTGYAVKAASDKGDKTVAVELKVPARGAARAKVTQPMAPTRK